MPPVVDVLVVSANTTPGLRRDFEELIAALNDAGLTVASATSTYGLLGRSRQLALALNEMVVAASLRHATRRALGDARPRAVLITTSTAGALLPMHLLSKAGIRFDGLAAGTRLRWQDSTSRAFERRCMRVAALALPYTERARSELQRLPGRRASSVVWPSPVRPGPQPLKDRWPAALCYANDPHKKGLDIAVAAWQLAAPKSHRLLVTGIEPETGRRFLRERGVTPAANVEWLGRLPEVEYRRLSASVLTYLGTSRVDQFATTQLEALLDGALLVTAPSKGPVEALELAQTLDRRLVADAITPTAVASAITTALGLTAAEQADYRARAHALLAPYSRAVFAETLRVEVLPRLLQPAEPALSRLQS